MILPRSARVLFHVAIGEMSKLPENREIGHLFHFCVLNNTLYAFVCCFVKVFILKMSILPAHPPFLAGRRLHRGWGGWQAGGERVGGAGGSKAGGGSVFNPPGGIWRVGLNTSRVANYSLNCYLGGYYLDNP